MKINKKILLPLGLLTLTSSVAIPVCLTSCSMKQIVTKTVLNSLQIDVITGKKSTDLINAKLDGTFTNDTDFFNALKTVCNMHFIKGKNITDIKNINVTYLKSSLKEYSFEFEKNTSGNYATIADTKTGKTLSFKLSFYKKNSKDKTIVSKDFKIDFKN